MYTTEEIQGQARQATSVPCMFIFPAHDAGTVKERPVTGCQGVVIVSRGGFRMGEGQRTNVAAQFRDTASGWVPDYGNITDPALAVRTKAFCEELILRRLDALPG